MHHRVHDMAPAPVMPDQIDRPVEAFQFVLEPVAVSKVCRRKVVGERSAEPRVVTAALRRRV